MSLVCIEEVKPGKAMWLEVGIYDIFDLNNYFFLHLLDFCFLF